MDQVNNSNQKVVDRKQPEQWRIREWFPELSDQAERNLKYICLELMKVNPTLGLVSAKTMPHADVLHFADSILAGREIFRDSKPKEIADTCSSGGFPGLVMAIIYPQMKVNFYEGDPAKGEFLKYIIKTLEIKNAEVIPTSIESANVGSIFMAVSRGGPAIPKSILGLRKQVKKDGCIYYLKGEGWSSEVSSIPPQLCSFWFPGLVGDYRLPLGEVKFSVVKLQKMVD